MVVTRRRGRQLCLAGIDLLVYSRNYLNTVRENFSGPKLQPGRRTARQLCKAVIFVIRGEVQQPIRTASMLAFDPHNLPRPQSVGLLTID